MKPQRSLFVFVSLCEILLADAKTKPEAFNDLEKQNIRVKFDRKRISENLLGLLKKNISSSPIRWSPFTSAPKLISTWDTGGFDYRGSRDPIAPPGSCVAGQLRGTRDDGNIQKTRGGLNRTFEKNIGHIFVVSKTLLAEYLKTVSDFLCGAECEGVD